MLQENNWALKEWAGVCVGLALGKSCLILRKGGIKEEQDKFVSEHKECWLYPTQFHQTANHYSAEYQDLLSQNIIQPAVAGHVELKIYVVILQVFHIHDPGQLSKILPYQSLSAEVMHQRFNYKTPGLCGLILKCYLAKESRTLPELPRYAGCKSWVELEDGISTEGLSPVIEVERLTSLQNEILNIQG